jgi:hypothetical protein
MSASAGVARPTLLLAGAIALLLCAPSAFAQGGGGTSPPGPGDPCPAVYPGNHAKPEAIALWMARAAALRDVPEQLPVMAALAESGLRNLNARGNPFAGFFSMHRSLNKDPYRGFPKHPELQVRWFLDTAVIVRQREIAEGDEDYAGDPTAFGIWIADVERPARENRDGYQPYLDDAGKLLDKACRPSTYEPDETPPALRVAAAGRQRDVVVVRARCPREPCLVGARAEPSRRVRAAPAVASEGAAITLSLPARARHTVSLVVTVTAVDEAGNATRKRKRIRLLR